MTATPAGCHRHRLTLSAAHDGGSDRDDLLAAEAHALGCGPCRAFRAALRRLDDLVAEADLPPAPDVASRLTVVPKRRSALDPRLHPARSMLAVVAVVQVLLGVGQLLGGGDPGTGLHAERHEGAWAVAFGVGLLLAAVRPRSARALLPVAATLAVVVVATSVVDVVAGRRVPPAEALHGLELAGVALLAVVVRSTHGSSTWGRPRRTLAGGT